MAQQELEYLIPLTEALGSSWPDDIFSLVGTDTIEQTLNKVGIAALDAREPASVDATLVFGDELSIEMPGLAGLALVFGATNARTEVNIAINLGEPFDARIVDFPIRLRFPRSLFKPVQPQNGRFIVLPDTALDIGVNATLIFEGDGNIVAEGIDQVAIPPFMIGDSGVIIEAENVQLHLSERDPPPDEELPEGWRGVFIERARIHLPDMSTLPDDLAFTNCSIGSGGFTGSFSTEWSNNAPTIHLFGLALTLNNLSLGFCQNALTDGAISGTMTLPFFDKPLAVEIGIDLDGGFVVRLAGGVEGDDVIDNNGLLTLTKQGLLTLQVESLGFEIINGEFAAKLSGTLQPLVDIGGVNWPSVKISEMTIYADGRVDLGGGWLNLPEQFHLDFHGFSAELTQIGFGETDDGYRWIGFSGGIQLVADLGLGAQFDGLRILWRKSDGGDIHFALEGVGVDLTIPDVLAFKGAVRFIDDNGQKGFKGGVKLTLYAINLEIDAEILVIKTDGFTAFYVYVNTDFPAGIPLASTGVALYGLAGLVGQNVAPNKTEQEMWYENWYKGKRLEGDSQEPGVAASVKWDPKFGSMAFGAGVTVGTVSDNGFAVNGKLLLALILPGPIILLEGRANLLAERSKLGGAGEPTFEALAVLDGQAGQFLLNVAAQYKQDDAGRIIDIRAGAEAFFDYHRADAWHLYLGQDEPREKRIRATVLSLFHADSYFMLSTRDLRLGFWVGFDESWDFGPLHAGLSAWIAADAAVSWKPVHVHGQLQLHGGFELGAFGFEVSLEVDARIAADAPTPFHIEAELEASLKLPWPLPDLEVDVTLEWGDNTPDPPIPLALGAASCEHLKVSEKWPLDRLPKYDTDGDGFWNRHAAENVNEDAVLARVYDEDDTDGDGFVGVPVVPLDVRPVLSFAKPVFDDIGFGHKREGLLEQVGETSFEYHLVSVELGKKPVSGGGWQQIALRSGDPAMEAAPDKLLGTWQLVNDGDDALPNAKLMFWSRTTYDWAREQAGPMYTTWLRGHLPDAFCPPPSPIVTTCFDWDGVPSGTNYGDQFTLDKLRFAKAPPAPAVAPMEVVHRPQAAFGRLHALRLAAGSALQTVELTISGFPYGTTRVTVSLEAPERVIVRAYYQGKHVATWEQVQPGNIAPSVEAAAIDRVVVRTRVLPAAQPNKNAYLYHVCYTAPLNPERQRAFIEWVSSADETRRMWHSTDNLLEPNQYYRLIVVTTVKRDNQEKVFTERTYFQTGQPPGADPHQLTAGDVGAGELDNQHEHFPSQGPLKDLSSYVQYTVPAAEARAVYRAYDIGAYFNENYVDAMYQLARKPLKVHLYDTKGNLVIGLTNAWGENPTLALTHTEVQWLYSLDQATCLDSLDPHELPPDQHLNAYASGLLLHPEALYEARLVADGADGGDGRQYPVYTWRFITSRFAHFRHHIGSFRDQVWDEHILRGQPEAVLLKAEQLTQLRMLVTAERNNVALPAGDSPRFEEIAALFGFGTQPQANQPGRWQRSAPRGVELTLLRDGTRRYGLLLESPEPLDRGRVTMRAQYSKTVYPLPHPPGAAKLLEARLAPSAEPVNTEYVDILLLHDQELSNWSIEHTGSANPENITFSTYYTFPVGSACKEGTLIRVHSGRAADDPVAGRPPIYRHCYARAKLNAGGDQLRLVDSLGNITHNRFFSRSQPDIYINREAVIIWNADQTAAFLFFPDGNTSTVGALPNGQYRLLCSFKRALAGYPTFKQENAAIDELVNLDLILRQ